MSILQQLVAELDAGRIKVVDLTQPLGPETPVIGLPPIFASSPGVTMEVISRYDEKGPAWYWNTSTSASTRERTSTRPSTGSPARTCRTTPATPSRPAGSWVPPAWWM